MEDELWNDQLDIHQKVHTVYSNELDTNWQDAVNIGTQYGSHRQESLDTQLNFYKLGIDALDSWMSPNNTPNWLHQMYTPIFYLPFTALAWKHANSIR